MAACEPRATYANALDGVNVVSNPGRAWRAVARTPRLSPEPRTAEAHHHLSTRASGQCSQQIIGLRPERR